MCTPNISVREKLSRLVRECMFHLRAILSLEARLMPLKLDITRRMLLKQVRNYKSYLQDVIGKSE